MVGGEEEGGGEEDPPGEGQEAHLSLSLCRGGGRGVTSEAGGGGGGRSAGHDATRGRGYKRWGREVKGRMTVLPSQ